MNYWMLNTEELFIPVLEFGDAGAPLPLTGDNFTVTTSRPDVTLAVLTQANATNPQSNGPPLAWYVSVIPLRDNEPNPVAESIAVTIVDNTRKVAAVALIDLLAAPPPAPAPAPAPTVPATGGEPPEAPVVARPGVASIGLALNLAKRVPYTPVG
jgi:hypothetical protein